MYTGLVGKVMIGETSIAYISNWSIENSTEIIEVTQLGKNYKEKFPTLQNWSASADGAIDFTDVGQVAIFKAKQAGTKVTVRMYLRYDEEQISNSVYFEGDGYIETLSVDLSAEDKGNVSISIAGEGELKINGVAGL